MTTTLQHDFRLPLRTEAELRDFLLLAFGVKIPNVAVCQGHSSPFEALADAYFARHRVSLWHASRGFGGKSFTLAMLALLEGTTLKADVSLLGGSGEQSRRVHQYLTDAWQVGSSPRHLVRGDPTKMETELVWGNHIRALLASQSSVRGPHPQRLRLDEVDETDIRESCARADEFSLVGSARGCYPPVLVTSYGCLDGTGGVDEVPSNIGPRGC